MEREPKRPFALMYVFAKIIEPGAPSLIRRTLPERLDEGRYASRGERCAETHLLELSYCTEEAKLRANCTYVASVYLDTSSDRAPPLKIPRIDYRTMRLFPGVSVCA